jgi:hypothetical protein
MDEGSKAKELTRAIALLLAGLEEFRRELSYAGLDLGGENSLSVRTEVRSFGDRTKVLKPMTDHLREIDCARVVAGLRNPSSNSTADYLPLERIISEIRSDPEYAQNLLPRPGHVAPDVRRIIVVLTDGRSSDEVRTRTAVIKLRELGVKVAAIGITRDGSPAEQLYAPEGQVCIRPADLANVLSVLLADVLKDVELEGLLPAGEYHAELRKLLWPIVYPQKDDET